MSEAIADILRSQTTAAWGPALNAADLLYRVTPVDLEASLTAFAESLCSKPAVRPYLPQASGAETPKESALRLAGRQAPFVLQPVSAYLCPQTSARHCLMCRRTWAALPC